MRKKVKRRRTNFSLSRSRLDLIPSFPRRPKHANSSRNYGWLYMRDKAFIRWIGVQWAARSVALARKPRWSRLRKTTTKRALSLCLPCCRCMRAYRRSSIYVGSIYIYSSVSLSGIIRAFSCITLMPILQLRLHATISPRTDARLYIRVQSHQLIICIFLSVHMYICADRNQTSSLRDCYSLPAH